MYDLMRFSSKCLPRQHAADHYWAQLLEFPAIDFFNKVNNIMTGRNGNKMQHFISI